MTVTRSDCSTFEVILEPNNDGGLGGFLELRTGLRLKVTDCVVWTLADDSYPPGLKFPAYILPAIWGLENDTPVRNVLAELARCGRETEYQIGSGDWLTNEQG
ncbi:MAG: hypothetical protein ACSHX9_00280 [Luteolibacter sp.]